jgi:xanthine dehydrogenase small subunit
VLGSAGGSRVLALEDFYLDYMKKDLLPGEFVAAVRVPRARKGLAFRSYKIAKRFDQDISAVCGAFTVELALGRVRAARVCFGGMAAIPRRGENCERALIGAEWNAATIARASQSLAKDFQPLTDMRASQDYRLRVARNLLQRFHAELTQNGRSNSVWNYVG